jgi:hypothetical protein
MACRCALRTGLGQPQAQQRVRCRSVQQQQLQLCVMFCARVTACATTQWHAGCALPKHKWLRFATCSACGPQMIQAHCTRSDPAANTAGAAAGGAAVQPSLVVHDQACSLNYLRCLTLSVTVTVVRPIGSQLQISA